MIALLLASALRLTPAEQFFCDDLYQETLQQCVTRTRTWVCTKSLTRRWPSDDEIAKLYAATIREERASVCRKRP